MVGRADNCVTGFFTGIIMAALLMFSLFPCGFQIEAAHGNESDRIVLGFKKEPGEDTVPSQWKHVAKPGKKENTILLEREGKSIIVHMKSLNSYSSLLTVPSVDLYEYPILAWRWKIDRVTGMAREDTIDRNDSVARVRAVYGAKEATSPSFVDGILKNFGFSLWPKEPAGYKIDYIWGNGFPRGTIIDYPGSSRHKIMFVESGEKKADRWVWEKRNLVEDYKNIFGGHAEGLKGILVLSDTEDTNEGVNAYFGNIVLMKKEND
ncbi:MAG: DUF3047 domain-containing protein [Syntrophales bacterium]|nr:DUF3047 domain-containing protein [Syntrophales bacterium]MDY0045069.1 DUF3047 domain-containing protein [Syntrophales bacterium]